MINKFSDAFQTEPLRCQVSAIRLGSLADTIFSANPALSFLSLVTRLRPLVRQGPAAKGTGMWTLCNRILNHVGTFGMRS